VIKNAVYSSSGMQHFGKQVAEILNWPLFVSTPVGDVERVLIIGMYDPPMYEQTLSDTARAKERIIQWCGTDVQLLQHSQALPFATHICDGEKLQDELRHKHIEAEVVMMPTLVHARVTPMPKDKVLAFYSGTNAEKYGAPIVKAVMDCLPEDWQLFSYAFGQFSPIEMESIIEQSTAYIRLTRHDGGMVSAREFLEVGKPVIVTQPLKFAQVVNPDDLVSVVKAVRRAGEQKEPNQNSIDYYTKFNSQERYLESLRGVGVIE